MKKYFRLLSLAAIIMILLFQSSCKKGWLDVNYNPRELTNTNASPKLLLPAMLEDAAVLPQDFEICSMWMGYWTGPNIPTSLNLSNYTNVPSLSIPSKTLPFLEEKSESVGMDFYLGIAKTLRAVAWSRCVDKLNDVPYSEAFKANILRPKYDHGKDIYDDLIKQLTIASILIKNSDIPKNEGIIESDIMFHGDRLKWLQFINTLKLRLLIHQANRPERAGYIASEIQVIKDQGSGFLPMGQDATVNPGYGLNSKLSPYYGYYSSHNRNGGYRGDLFSGVNSVDIAHANEYGLNLLKEDIDPRIGFIYSSIDTPVPAGGAEPFVQPGPANFRGSRFGLSINAFQFPYQSRPYISAVGGSRNTDIVSPGAQGIIKGNNMSNWVLTSVENAFLQAEAINRGWLAGDAEQGFKNAVKESFRWLNLGGNMNSPALSDAIFDQWYLSQANNPRVSWTAAPDKYKLIMYQKYIGLNGIDPIETWVDYRRNNRFPDLPVSVDPTRIGNTIPFRLVYSPDEIISNGANVKALGEINAFTGKIWWMP